MLTLNKYTFSRQYIPFIVILLENHLIRKPNPLYCFTNDQLYFQIVYTWVNTFRRYERLPYHQVTSLSTSADSAAFFLRASRHLTDVCSVYTLMAFIHSARGQCILLVTPSRFSAPLTFQFPGSLKRMLKKL